MAIELHRKLPLTQHDLKMPLPLECALGIQVMSMICSGNWAFCCLLPMLTQTQVSFKVV